MHDSEQKKGIKTGLIGCEVLGAGARGKSLANQVDHSTSDLSDLTHGGKHGASVFHGVE